MGAPAGRVRVKRSEANEYTIPVITTMSDQRSQELLEKLAKETKKREQQLPREVQLERKGRVRNKYRLLEKWETTLDEYSGPGWAKLVTGYRPSGIQAPVDVPEIAGLIVWDEDRIAHHFRLYRTERAAFIEIPDDPHAKIWIDPMEKIVDNDRYVRDRPPRAALEILDTLEITPSWENACADGEHDFITKDEGTPFETIRCETCRNGQAVLTWLGHSVPFKDEIAE